jgi:hypothetical protein
LAASDWPGDDDVSRVLVKADVAIAAKIGVMTDYAPVVKNYRVFHGAGLRNIHQT